MTSGKSREKKGEAAVAQLGLLCRYMYTNILNLVLVNLLQFTFGTKAHLDPLRPRICTPLKIVLAPGSL